MDEDVPQRLRVRNATEVIMTTERKYQIAVGGLAVALVFTSLSSMNNLRECRALRKQAAQAAPSVSATPTRLPSDDILALKAKIIGLEQQLKTFAGEIAEAATTITDTVEVAETEQPQDRRPRGPEGWREELERIKREDPERYAEMEKRRNEWVERQKARAEAVVEFYDSFDVAKMTPEHKVNYEKLLAVNDQFKAFQAARDAGEEVDREAVRQTVREAEEVYRNERQYLLADYASAIGQNKGDFAETIKTIYDNTDLRSVMGGGRGGPPPGGRGGNR